MPKPQLEERNLTNNIFLILKGIVMGTANKVPGVSGGVVAFVGGFYEEFIYSLQKINFKALKLLIGFRFKTFWSYINGNFLGLLMLGMLISYFSVSKLLDYFLAQYELYVWSLFFGMIIGSVIYISKQYDNWNLNNVIYLILGAIVGVGISMMHPAAENDNLWFVFFCGVIGVSGMTLPGLSGSFILIVLGNYVLLLVDTVNALYDSVVYIINNDYSFLNDVAHMRLLSVLVVFSLGSLVGLVGLSHALGLLLKKFKDQTFAVIIGFIVGSLGVVWPWKNKIYKMNSTQQLITDANGDFVLDHYERFIPDWSIQVFIACFWVGVGVATVLYIEYIGKKSEV